MLKSAPVPQDAEIQRLKPRRDRRWRRKRRVRKSKKQLSVPAPVMFWITSFVGLVGIVLVYSRGARFLAFSVVAGLFILAVLVINERTGFAQSKRLRRSYESRTSFNKIEVVILFLLLMADAFFSIVVWMK